MIPIKSKLRIPLLFSVLSVLLLIVMCLSVFIGSADLDVQTVIQSLFSSSDESSAAAIIWRIRLPRVTASMILGGALALSGYLLQIFFHNPIAGPFTLGTSSGAKLFVAVSLVLSARRLVVLNSAVMITAAFLGAMMSLGFVLLVSHKFTNSSMLIVCGVMISYICSAVTDLIITFAADSDIVNLRNWSQGTFSGTTMADVRVMAVVIFVILAVTVCLSKPLSAYMLGENYAKSVGVGIKSLRVTIILLSGMLAACVTAFAGPVSFIGVAVPHIIRLLFRTSKPSVLIAGCFLGGAIICMLCDMAARTLFSPTELSISTVTAIFGAPVVIALMLDRRKGESQ